MTLQAAEQGQREVVESSFPNPWAPRAEEYWPDMEGLDYRDTVTDFDLPEGTFFDCAVVHLLTTATLDRLRELYPAGRFEVRRFRLDLVVETGSGVADFAENAWPSSPHFSSATPRQATSMRRSTRRHRCSQLPA